MKLREIIDGAVEVFAPRAARHRMAERLALDVLRDYDAANAGRRNSGWRRPSSSADREGQKALTRTRDTGYDLVRNNKYAVAIDIHLTAQLVGDGIAPRASHPNKKVQKAAQKAMDAWMKSRVDGRRDAFGVQKLAASGMVVGGETFIIWSPDEKGPDGRCRVLEGAFCDHMKNRDTPTENPIVQGVEFDRLTGDRVAYWLFDRHPGDGFGYFGQSKRYDAANIDHVYDERRPGQTRGISWLAPVAPTLRDVAETVDAKVMKEKVAACLSVVLTSAEGGPAIDPFAKGAAAEGAPAANSAGKGVDKIAPGQILRARAGETVSVVNPPQSGEGVQVIQQELMGVAATTVPYHILTGDPSQANYSSLRALTNPFHARLDDVQQNILVPFVCAPMAERRMRRLAMETGDRRYRDVEWTWSMPVRRSNDPIKDFMGEFMEIRAGMKSVVKGLTERGLNPDDHVQEIADWLALTDKLGLAFDSDPRRLTAAGNLQPPAGYLYGGDTSQGG